MIPTSMPTRTPPTALLFDFGGTLDADGIAWKERFRTLVSQEGIAVEPERFDKMFYEADDALVGRLPKDLSLQETARRLARGLAERMGESPELAERVAAGFLRESIAKLDANAAVLRALAGRYRIGVVSNFYGNLAAICSGTSIGPYVSTAVDSAAVGASKPDPRIFQAALEALETSADRAIFIGDSLPRDMEGARRLGMPHVWMQPGATAACCPDDAVIGSVTELLGMLP